MTSHDLEHLKDHQQKLLLIADSLESICERSSSGHRMSALLRIVAELHDHHANLMDVLEANSRMAGIEAAGFR